MATGSGKTLVMAGLMLYLYEKGYRNFLFFVNSNVNANIIINTFANEYFKDILFNNNNIRFF
jgi:type III restriction enzyme